MERKTKRKFISSNRIRIQERVHVYHLVVYIVYITLQQGTMLVDLVVIYMHPFLNSNSVTTDKFPFRFSFLSVLVAFVCLRDSLCVCASLKNRSVIKTNKVMSSA